MPEKIGEISRQGAEGIQRPSDNIELERALFEKYKLKPSHELEEKILKEYEKIVDRVINIIKKKGLVQNDEDKEDMKLIGELGLLHAIRSYNLPPFNINNRSEYRGFRYFAYRVVTNRIFDHLRINKKRLQIETGQYIEDIDENQTLLVDPNSSTETDEILSQANIDWLLKYLSPEERSLLAQRFGFDGEVVHTFEELGKANKKPTGKSNMYRMVEAILNSIRKSLGQKD